MQRNPKEIAHIEKQRRRIQDQWGCSEPETIPDHFQVWKRRCQKRPTKGYLRKRRINPWYDSLAFYEPEVKIEQRDYKIKRNGHDHWEE